MLKIVYSPDGKAVNDFMVELEYSDVVLWKLNTRAHVTVLYYSTDNIFARIRLGVVKGEINCKDIIFVYQSVNTDGVIDYIELPVNEYGVIRNWPNGFCDYTAIISEKILRGAMNKRKENKKSF